MSRPFTPLADRLLSKLNLEGPMHPYDSTLGRCHEFQGSKNKGGYGEIGAGGKRGKILVAHRAAYELVHSCIVPRGIDVCHSCDNRSCCNVDHLFAGTRKENMHDCIRKGRAGKRNRKLSTIDVDAIRMFSEFVNPITKRCLYTQKQLSVAFGVTQSNISCIVSGKSWTTNDAIGGCSAAL